MKLSNDVKRSRATTSTQQASRAPEAEPAAPEARAGGTLLTLHLVGRICLFSHGDRHVALFLDIRKNSELDFPEHHPIVRAAMDDCTKAGADLASVTLADDRGRVQALWDLRGFDMQFTGLMSSAEPMADIEPIADLKAAFRPIDGAAQWRSTELLNPDPRPYGVIARLSLTGFDRIDSMFFDGDGRLRGASEEAGRQTRTFLPGEFRQEGHAVIRCTGSFRQLAADKPTLQLTSFGGTERKAVPFDDTAPFQLTFSNLCNCVGTDVSSARTARVAGEDLVMEDREFAAYYELLEDPPAEKARPVPFVPREGAGGGGVVQCVPTARLN